MRLRRLRSGVLAAVRLRRDVEEWPRQGLREDPTVDTIPEPENLRGPGGEPPRPLPAANAWPDDAVLVTYAELRKLIALHLDLVWQAMPKDHPWLWVRRRATAMRDGESPLLIAEVMDPGPGTAPPGSVTP